MAGSDVVWNTDAVNALGSYKFISSLTGNWPLQGNGIFSRIRFYVAFFLAITALLSLIREAILHCGDTDASIDCFGVLGSSIFSLSKMLTLRIHRSNMIKIFSSAIEDWSTVDEPSSKLIMKKYARRANIVCRVQMYGALLIVLMILLDVLSTAIPRNDLSLMLNSSVAVTTRMMELPLRTNCAFGDLSMSFYWILFAFQSLQLVNAVALDSGNDVIFFGIVMHVCGQLEVLRSLWCTMGLHEQDERATCEIRIKELIDRHRRVFVLTQRLRDTYDVVILVLVVIKATHLCLVGVQILYILKSIDPVLVTKCGFVGIVVLIQIFIYSYAGDNLSRLSQGICEATYECQWYDLPPKVSRNLVFVMMKANDPFRLTAGKLFTVNIESFMAIVRGSFSCFSVLRVAFNE